MGPHVVLSRLIQQQWLNQWHYFGAGQLLFFAEVSGKSVQCI